MTDWTGATWIFGAGNYKGQRVTITGKRNDKDFGKVWVGEVDGDEVIFTAKRLDQDLCPKSRKPKNRSGACA